VWGTARHRGSPSINSSAPSEAFRPLEISRNLILEILTSLGSPHEMGPLRLEGTIEDAHILILNQTVGFWYRVHCSNEQGAIVREYWKAERAVSESFWLAEREGRENVRLSSSHHASLRSGGGAYSALQAARLQNCRLQDPD